MAEYSVLYMTSLTANDADAAIKASGASHMSFCLWRLLSLGALLLGRMLRTAEVGKKRALVTTETRPRPEPWDGHGGTCNYCTHLCCINKFSSDNGGFNIHCRWNYASNYSNLWKYKRFCQRLRLKRHLHAYQETLVHSLMSNPIKR